MFSGTLTGGASSDRLAYLCSSTSYRVLHKISQILNIDCCSLHDRQISSDLALKVMVCDLSAFSLI